MKTAWGLSSRCTVAKVGLRITFVVAVATLAVLALVIGFGDYLDFTDWWAGVSWVALVLSWCVAVAAVIVIVRALRAGERPAVRPQVRPPGPWG